MSFIKGYSHSLCEKYTLPTDINKEMDKKMRELLTDRGYLSLPKYHMLQYRRVYPCSWCRTAYGTTDAEIITVLYLNHDETVLHMDYIDIRSNVTVINLEYLVTNHPDESCPFVEAQLFRKVYDDTDNVLPEMILRRKFHSEFYVKDILWSYIKTGQNKRLYDMVMRICAKPINYVFKSDTTDEEIERFAKYFCELREKCRENENQMEEGKPLKLTTQLTVFGLFDRMPICMKPDMNHITVEFHAPFQDKFGKRPPEQECYHANLRLKHSLKLGEELVKHCDVVMNLSIIEECLCDCPEQPIEPEYPKEDTYYAKAKN